MNANPERRARVEQLLREGLSMRQISIIEGVNRSTIGFYAKRMGLLSANAANRRKIARRRLIKAAAVRVFGYLTENEVQRC